MPNIAIRFPSFSRVTSVTVVVAWLVPLMLHTQGAIAVLSGERARTNAARIDLGAKERITVQSFDFARNLIFFEASVDGKAGNFILDTGAPSLLVNNRGENDRARVGLAAGGEVEVTDQLVENFEMGGESIKNYWALGLDLRSMEQRVGRKIDGYVGYDLLDRGELRIDYDNRNFWLQRSSRRPLHLGSAPKTTFRFTYVDHLPVITLKVGKQKLRFALDTGAGANLLDDEYAADPTLVNKIDGVFNIQGLDGEATNHASVSLTPSNEVLARGEAIEFVSYDLSHLQGDGAEIAGILGSKFLSRFTVGIDYRRRRVYFW